MKKVENDESDKRVVLSEKLYADFEPAAPPVAPDGGIAPGYALEQPAASPSFDDAVCMKGPCRHYWQLVGMFDSENPKSTWSELGIAQPRQIFRTCLVSPGMETDLTEDFVYECSRWDPLAPAELLQLTARRNAYNETNPIPEEEVPDGNDSDDAA